jgi:hypothetical protein
MRFPVDHQIEGAIEMKARRGHLRSNRKTTVSPKREGRSENGIPFFLKCGLIKGRKVRVIRGCRN